MSSPSPVRRLGARVTLLLLALLAAAPAALAFGDKDWLPVEPSHLSMSAPVVERDADAEAIFWEVRVADEVDGGGPRTVLNHYVRIKIFTERGRESQSRVDILAPKFRGREIKIKDIAGRTIKPDGSIVELKKEDIFERTVVKASGLKVNAKTFAMPGVVPGAIIEYRWREIRGDTLSLYDHLEFSRDIPVQFVKYYVKPITAPGFNYGMRIRTFNGQMTPFRKESNGFYSTSMTNVPAFREESRMPPENAVRPWMLVYYAEGGEDVKPDKYFADWGRRIHEATKPLLKVNDDIKRASAEAVGDASAPEQKLERLFLFVREKIKSVNDDASGLTEEQRKKAKENKTPADTLKRGVGTSADIDLLFGALASAAGFEVRIASTTDRGYIFFPKDFPDDYFINPASVAVRVGEQWRFFNPGYGYVPFGMLRWQEEGTPTLISDGKEPQWVISPVSAPQKSLEKRTGKFKLGEDGTLEGDVTIEYTGHFAADHKEYNDDDTPAEREETLKNKFRERMGGVEITDIRVENVTDSVKPFVYRFHVVVPGYAQRTGKRLFVQPAFFQRGVGPMFPTSSRRHEVYFHYPWSEEDSVEIELPEGFALDNPESPAPTGAGEMSQYMPKAQVTKDGRTLIYSRKFFFGGSSTPGGGILLFPTATYPQLKTYFDVVHKQDGHTLSLKQGAPAAATTTGQQ